MSQKQAVPPDADTRAEGTRGSGPLLARLGLVSLIVACTGMVLILPFPLRQLVPGAWGVGVVLLPVALILAVVSLLARARDRALGMAGLIVAAAGILLAVVSLFAVVEQMDSEPPGEPQGTRENPYGLWQSLANEEWDLVINSVTFDATDRVLAQDPDNAPPPPGSEYMLVNVTITYIGDDAGGGVPAVLDIGYLDPSGAAIAPAPSGLVAPGRLDLDGTLRKWDTIRGDIVFAVPAQGAEEGLISVGPVLAGHTIYWTTS